MSAREKMNYEQLCQTCKKPAQLNLKATKPMGAGVCLACWQNAGHPEVLVPPQVPASEENTPPVSEG